MQKVLKGIYYFFVGILGILFLFLLFYVGQNVFADLTKSKPLIRLYTIISPSMEPNVNIYDIVLVKKVNKDTDIQKGDIITFYSDTLIMGEYTVTHRVNKIEQIDGKLMYQTKGDNNPLPDDGYRTFEDIQGKCITIFPGFGKFQAFLASNIGWVLIILIPAFCMIIYDLFKIIKIYRINKRVNKVSDNPNLNKYQTQEFEKKLNATIEQIDKISEDK